jgi:hypothetical protein
MLYWVNIYIYMQLCLMLLILLCMDSAVGISWSISFAPRLSAFDMNCIAHTLNSESIDLWRGNQ